MNYLKLGGGYSLGKRFHDANDKLLVSSMPNDYGKAIVHLQGGLEKNLHLSDKKSFSVGLMLNIQFIKSYYAEYSRGTSQVKLNSYIIPYKFGGFTFAYHFY